MKAFLTEKKKAHKLVVCKKLKEFYYFSCVLAAATFNKYISSLSYEACCKITKLKMKKFSVLLFLFIDENLQMKSKPIVLSGYGDEALMQNFLNYIEFDILN